MPIPRRVIPGRVYTPQEIQRFRNGYFQCAGESCGTPTTHRTGFCAQCRKRKCATKGCDQIAPNHAHCGKCLANLRERKE